MYERLERREKSEEIPEVGEWQRKRRRMMNKQMEEKYEMMEYGWMDKGVAERDTERRWKKEQKEIKENNEDSDGEVDRMI